MRIRSYRRVLVASPRRLPMRHSVASSCLCCSHLSRSMPRRSSSKTRKQPATETDFDCEFSLSRPLCLRGATRPKPGVRNPAQVRAPPPLGKPWTCASATRPNLDRTCDKGLRSPTLGTDRTPEHTDRVDRASQRASPKLRKNRAINVLVASVSRDFCCTTLVVQLCLASLTAL
jgi:hypothetical protein